MSLKVKKQRVLNGFLKKRTDFEIRRVISIRWNAQRAYDCSGSARRPIGLDGRKQVPGWLCP